MFIINGIAYARSPMREIAVESVRPLDDMILLITFINGEQRLYDASALLSMPAFAPLADNAVFKTAEVIQGILTWQHGDIDIAPETLYRDSFPYEHPA